MQITESFSKSIAVEPSNPQGPDPLTNAPANRELLVSMHGNAGMGAAAAAPQSLENTTWTKHVQ